MLLVKNPLIRFPDPRQAPGDAPLAVGGDLKRATLIEAYTQGIFPWYGPESPILWWSPDPRCVLVPSQFHLPHGLARRLDEPWEVTADHAFREVIEACASSPRPGQHGTWLTSEMRDAYTSLHRFGYAHSIEVWRDGAIIGGLYGVALGGAFFGESMFYREPDASKIALVSLIHYLRAEDYALIDCQQHTAHLARFGAETWPRDRFLDVLKEAVNKPTVPGSWSAKTFSPQGIEHP